MAAPHYTPSGKPVQGSAGNSKDLRDEFELVETGIQVLNAIPMSVYIDDLNTAQSAFIMVPWACKIIEWLIAPQTSQSGTSLITLEINTTEVTGSLITVTGGDGPGDVLTAVPTALNQLIDNGALEIVTDGGGTNVNAGLITLLFERT